MVRKQVLDNQLMDVEPHFSGELLLERMVASK
jgi:hypothetical protein